MEVKLGTPVFFLLLAAVSVTAYFRPKLEGDIANNAAAVLVLHDPNFARVQRQVFQQVTAEFKNQLPEHPSPFWSGIQRRPEYLIQQVPYYTAKPLYVLAAAWLGRIGLPAVKALQLISAISFFLIGVVIWLWVRDPLVAALLILCAEVIALARTGTADAFSVLCVLLGLFFVWRGKFPAAALFLLISVWVRVDNALLTIMVFLWMAYRLLAPWTYAVALAGVAALSAAAIHRFSGMNMAVLFYRSQGAIANLSAVSQHLSVHQYSVFLGLALRSVFSETESGVWFLIALLAWRRWRGTKAAEMLLIGALAWLAHLVLFPFPADRFVVWFYLLAGISLALSTSAMRSVAGPGMARPSAAAERASLKLRIPSLGQDP